MRVTIRVKLIISTSLIFLLSNAIEAKRPAYRKDYRYEKAFDAFYKLHHTAVDWHRARIRCEAEGAELVVPESLDEADALMLVISPSLNKFEGVFIGVHDIYAEGLFVTINGDFFANTFMELLWEQLQPKQGGGRCVGMRRNGKLFAHDCLNRLPFVCKKRASEIVFYPDCVTFDKRWVLGPNNTCYMTHTEQQTWYDAFDTCAGAGGHLVTPDTKNETDYIASLFNQVVQPVTEDDFAFLGFNDLFIRFHYRTVFGDPLGSQLADWDNRCADEKDIKNVEERCGGLSRTGLLTTSACDTPAVFFCEKPANDSSAIQIYTTATSANTQTLKTKAIKTVATSKKVTKKTNTTPARKFKKKLRNLDTSHTVEKVSLATTQALENVRVHADKFDKNVRVMNSYKTKVVDKASVDVITPKKTVDFRNLDTTLAVEVASGNDNTSPTAEIVSLGTTQAYIDKSRVHADESNKTVAILKIPDTTKSAHSASINVNTPNKTVEVLRNLDTTLSVEEFSGSSPETSSTDLSPKLETVLEVEDILPKIETDLINEDTVLPTVNRHSVDVDTISTTLKTDTVDELPTVKTDLVDEDIIPIIDTDTQTEESPTPYPFLQSAQTDGTNHEDGTTHNNEPQSLSYDY